MARSEVPREVDGFSFRERHIAISYVRGKKAVVIAEVSVSVSMCFVQSKFLR
jgi:hypothetical protein